MKTPSLVIVNLFILVVSLSGNRLAFSYEVSTHKILNEKATINSGLDNYLKVNLGVSDGIETIIAGRKIRNWISNAGISEDSGWRFLRHFHNPLKSWDQAGLNETALLLPVWGQSSLLWGLNPAGEQDWSWHDARKYYLKALTASAHEERERNLAKTFRAVGQVMHLIADASVPAHTRNDAHPFGYHYETWAKEKELELHTDAVTPQLDLSISRNGMVPITQFFDTDHYFGINPEVTDRSDIGLAEYTNAHFFSENTIFAEEFPQEDRHHFLYPDWASVDPVPWTDETNNLQYLSEIKSKEEGGNQHVVLVSFLYEYREVYFPQTDEYLPVGLDGKVYKEQAARLVPRAVGYSAKLLEYFFRGSIDAEGDGTDGIRIRNTSNESLDGVMSLYYDAVDPATGQEVRKLAGGPWTLTLAPGGQSGTQTFSDSSDAKEPGNFWLVFTGRLGAEENAVAGRFIELETIPYGFIIQDEVIAPAPISISKSSSSQEGWKTIIEAVEKSVWVSKKSSFDPEQVPHSQKARGRFVFLEAPESITLIKMDNTAFYINGQLISGGTWHQGDTPDPPQTWQYVDNGSGCTNSLFGCYDRAAIEVVFKGGETLQQSLWLYQWVEKSSSLKHEAGTLATIRYAEMAASTGNDSAVRYYAPGFRMLFPGPSVYTPNHQFEILRWPGYHTNTPPLCDPTDISCRLNNYVRFTWGYDPRLSRRPFMLSYKRWEHKIIFTNEPGSLLPQFDLTVAGEVRRVYSPRELAFLEGLGVAPIEYSVIFR